MMNVYTPAEAHTLALNNREESPFGWIHHVLPFIRRRWLTVVGITAMTLMLAAIYLAFATPIFTATSAILIDIRQSNPFKQQQVTPDATYESVYVESQVEIMRSTGLARSVVAQQDLTKDPQFNSIGPGLVGTIVGTVMGLLIPSEPALGSFEERLKSAAVDKLMGLVSIRRVGTTAMVEISVRTPYRDLSARLTNAVVDAYLQNQLSSSSAVASLATSWMQKRIVELRNEAIAADRAVQEYKASRNILNTDKGRFSEQQLGEVSAQLTTARARVADAQAKFDRVRSISADRLGDESLTEALENTVIVGLRRQYLDARRRESEWTTRYGSSHAAAVNARIEMNELQRSIQNELSRISQAYRSELEIAKANETQISQQLAQLAGELATTNADGIMLRALQSSADSYKMIYENFLQRYTQAVQDQSFPIASGRVITPALPPLRKSQPKALVVLGAGLIVGLGLGTGLALLREIMDRGIRTPIQVKASTGHDCLGLLPRQSGRVGTDAGAEAQPPSRLLATRSSMLRHVIDQPNSAYAEGMRGIALRTVWQQRAPGPQVIGCFALQDGEGASTVAANLAHALTEAGYSTLLVDLDLRKASLTRALAPSNAGGAAEVAEGGVPLDQAVWRDPQTGLRFLPAAAGQSAARPARVLAPTRMERLLTGMRAGYDRIVIDLPALGDTADVAVIAELLDSLVVVSTWGSVSGTAFNEALDTLHDSRDKVIGIVLNRAELKQLGQYGAAALVPKAAAA